MAGKVAVITGAGSSGSGIGTGKASSILFAREGARVVLVNRVLEHAEEVLTTVQNEGGTGLAVAGDVSVGADCERIVQSVLGAYGALHILINNVGTAGSGSVLDVPEDEWDRVFAINLKSMMLMSKHSIPAMTRSGGGSVVNISSMGAWYARTQGSAAYHASKGGVVSLTKSMAIAHGGAGVRVNCVAPGLIYTPMVAAGMSPADRERRRVASPLGIEGTAWDVAWAALFLASDEARWITATTIEVDGGIFSRINAFDDQS